MESGKPCERSIHESSVTGLGSFGRKRFCQNAKVLGAVLGSIGMALGAARIISAFDTLRPKTPRGSLPASSCAHAYLTRGHWQRGLSTARHAEIVRTYWPVLLASERAAACSRRYQ